MNMGINSAFWVWGVDLDGKPVKVHTPFVCCRCSAHSCYGKDGLWYCLEHWLHHTGAV